MTRRISALVGIAVLILLLTILVWHVYLHHEAGEPSDEPSIVRSASRPAFSPA